MKRGAAGFLAAVCALCVVRFGWGTEPAQVTLLDLPDRDAVVLTVGGEALVSKLVVHKLRPSRLEALYRYSGELPTVGDISGDLVKGVAISPRQEGFMLTLTLADDVPVDGEQIYRESVVGTGRTALEVFASESNRSPFKAAWLAGGADEATPVLASVPAAAPLEPASMAAAPASEGFEGVSFDPGTMTLTLKGAGGEKYEVVKQQFPPRVDVTLPGAAGRPGLMGVAYKNLSGKVTFVEVTDAKSGSGLVVRASLAPDTALTNQAVQGSNLVLSFGPTAAEMPASFNTPKPAESAPLASAPAETHTLPTPADLPNIPPGQSTSLGDALSAAVGGAPADLTPPVGLDGETQQVPSVEQVLQMARADAARYGENAEGRSDIYGTYELPGFPGEEQQLSDVRVNLDASAGFNVYQFLMFLSQISGISFIIDPYLRQEPTGNRRQPLDEGFIPGGGGGNDTGFRGANVFAPQLGESGFVIGRFDNMAFDQALDMVLETQMLKKVVIRDKNDPYSKPVIMITSKERLEQELRGQNEIDLYQLHYADPQQIYQILYQLNLLPSINVGWYVYQGNTGGNNQGGQGGGGNQGGGGGNFQSASASDVAAAGEAVRGNYFDTTSDLGNNYIPLQGAGGGGGGGAGGGGGGQGGGGRGGGGQGGGGNQTGGGVPLPTAKSGLVVMRGTRDTLDTVQSLIAKIDKPPKQVALNVRIYSVSDSPENTWGLLRATAQKDRINSTYSLGQLDVDVLAKGGVMLDENYTAAFEFLQSEDKATLITEEEIAVIDGFTAELDDSRTRGNLVTTWTVDQNGNRISSSNYESQTVGAILSFTPQVDDRGRVTLEVDINNSSFDGPEQIAPNGQATFQPRRDTTLFTVLRLVDGQSMVIGGLTSMNDSRQFAGIPYLSKLPIIGQFLGHTSTTHSVNHLFIAIKVNIIDDK